jgi:TetR/AcrR family transcriptional regulator
MTVTPSTTSDGPAEAVLAAGHRLVIERGTNFTTHELVKEAGVALQTFYRYFGGKDQLLLALIADLIRNHCATLVAGAEGITDPAERLEHHIRATLRTLGTPAQVAGAQFITAEHWRLVQLFPDDVAAATQPVVDLVRDELVAGRAAGVLRSRNPDRDAWLITKTIMSTYHEYAFRPDDPAMATIVDDACAFCLAAVGTGARAARRSRRQAAPQRTET